VRFTRLNRTYLICKLSKHQIATLPYAICRGTCKNMHSVIRAYRDTMLTAVTNLLFKLSDCGS
jgi:hypothetical protein